MADPPRAYRLRSDEPLGDEVKRAALARTKRAVERLGADLADDPALAVHGARKDLKKLRSLLRLAREGIGGRSRRAINEAARDAGRLLSGARDAEVILDATRALKDQYVVEFPSRFTTGFVDELTRRRDMHSRAPGRIHVEQAVALVEKAQAEIECWSLDGMGFDLIEPGLRREYGRGRKVLQGIGNAPDDEAVHQWRKRVKDYSYHVRLLEPVWPPAMGGLRRAADELAELLGDHHDLSVLATRALELPEGFGDHGQRTFVALTQRRRAEILGEAFPIARRLYAEKPKRFAIRMRRYAAGTWKGSD